MAEFRFRQFMVDDRGCGMKICSDSVLLGAWFLPAVRDARSVADAGAGSGVLSLMAAQECPDADIYAVELDPGAADASEANFAASPWAERMKVVCGDFLTVDLPVRPDVIVSNPPYFDNGAVSPDTARAAARHQASLSYRTLIERAAAILAPDGQLGMVSPPDCENDIIFAAELAGLRLRRLWRVTTTPRRPERRLLWHFGREACPTEIRRFDMRRPDGAPSDEYIALVDPFYIKIS